MTSRPSRAQPDPLLDRLHTLLGRLGIIVIIERSSASSPHAVDPAEAEGLFDEFLITSDAGGPSRYATESPTRRGFRHGGPRAGLRHSARACGWISLHAANAQRYRIPLARLVDTRGDPVIRPGKTLTTQAHWYGATEYSAAA